MRGSYANNYGFRERDRRYQEAMQRDRERRQREAIAAYLQEQEQKRIEKESIERMTIKQHFEKVHTMRQDLPRWYRELFREKLTEELQAVDRDINLSAQGKQAKKAEIRAKYRKEVLNWSKQCRDIQEAEFAEITKKARSVLDKPTTKPDDLTIDRFRRSIADLKADIAVGLSASSAVAQIRKLTDSVTDPYLGEMLRDEFANLVGMVGGGLTGEDRQALGKSLEGLRSRTKLPEVIEAEDAVEMVAMMRQSNVFNPFVTGAIENDLGADVARAMNNAEAVSSLLASMEVSA